MKNGKKKKWRTWWLFLQKGWKGRSAPCIHWEEKLVCFWASAATTPLLRFPENANGHKAIFFNVYRELKVSLQIIKDCRFPRKKISTLLSVHENSWGGLCFLTSFKTEMMGMIRGWIKNARIVEERKWWWDWFVYVAFWVEHLQRISVVPPLFEFIYVYVFGERGFWRCNKRDIVRPSSHWSTSREITNG